MDPEIGAMSKVAEALQEVDEEAQKRILSWASDKFGIKLEEKTSSKFSGGVSGENSADEEQEEKADEFETFAELYAAASPSSESEKVLVAGYWHQVVKGQSFITSAPLNKDLKDLGHAVANISEKFDTLKGTKPQLAIQIKKSGTSAQARKQYKITTAGITKVKGMLGA